VVGLLAIIRGNIKRRDNLTTEQIESEDCFRIADKPEVMAEEATCG
jgi:hypothetical protein